MRSISKGSNGRSFFGDSPSSLSNIKLSAEGLVGESNPRRSSISVNTYFQKTSNGVRKRENQDEKDCRPLLRSNLCYTYLEPVDRLLRSAVSPVIVGAAHALRMKNFQAIFRTHHQHLRSALRAPLSARRSPPRVFPALQPRVLPLLSL